MDRGEADANRPAARNSRDAKALVPLPPLPGTFCSTVGTRLDTWSIGNERSRQRAAVDLHGKAAKTATHTDVPKDRTAV
jgi:hypothetical protein